MFLNFQTNLLTKSSWISQQLIVWCTRSLPCLQEPYTTFGFVQVVLHVSATRFLICRGFQSHQSLSSFMAWTDLILKTPPRAAPPCSWRIHMAPATWETADVERCKGGLCSSLSSSWDQSDKALTSWTFLEMGDHFAASLFFRSRLVYLGANRRCENEVCTYPVLVNQFVRLILHANPENSAGCKSALLPFNTLVRSIIAVQPLEQKALFCVLRDWRALGFCLPKKENRQTNCCSGCCGYCTSKHSARPKPVEIVWRKLVLLGLQPELQHYFKADRPHESEMLLDCFGIKDVAKINSQALQKSVFTAYPQSGSWFSLNPKE